MGSCVSVHRDSESAMKLRPSFGSSKTGDKLLIPQFPVVPDKLTTNGDRPINDLPLKSHWSPSRSAATPTTFRDYGSGEEAYFDTRPWLDSDCEDDFYSVNGDFTPSRGNTPVHPIESSRMNKTPFENRTPASISPVVKKKKLLELFQESFRDDEAADNETMANGKMKVKPTRPIIPPKSVNGTPSVSLPNSVSDSERTMNGDVLAENERPFRSAQCCLPSLVSYCSPSQRKKMSPTIAVIDKA